MWVGFDQPAPIGREAYGARVALPIWADFMKRTARALPAGEFAVPDGLRGEELCSVSYLQPVEGCPVYTEYFKDGDVVPSALCPIHRGTFKQRAARACQGFSARSAVRSPVCSTEVVRPLGYSFRVPTLFVFSCPSWFRRVLAGFVARKASAERLTLAFNPDRAFAPGRYASRAARESAWLLQRP